MRYEVTVTVKTVGTTSDTLKSIKQHWEFGDNEKWRLAGEAYVIEKTVDDLVSDIRNQIAGSKNYNLNDTSGNPRRA